jgi:hypothetical protein
MACPTRVRSGPLILQASRRLCTGREARGRSIRGALLRQDPSPPPYQPHHMTRDPGLASGPAQGHLRSTRPMKRPLSRHGPALARADPAAILPAALARRAPALHGTGGRAGQRHVMSFRSGAAPRHTPWCHPRRRAPTGSLFRLGFLAGLITCRDWPPVRPSEYEPDGSEDRIPPPAPHFGEAGRAPGLKGAGLRLSASCPTPTPALAAAYAPERHPVL